MKQIINIKEVEPSKESVHMLAEKIVKSVEDGFKRAVELSSKLDFISKVCLEAKNSLKEKTIKEVEQGFSAKGYKVEVCEAGVSYDYSRCNDSEYKELIDRMNALQKRIKDREKFLKSLKPEGFEYVDSETGEVIKLYPPVKKSTTTPRFTLI